jgi:hypothetical protein
MFDEESAHLGSLHAKVVDYLFLNEFILCAIKADEFIPNLNPFIEWFTFCDTNKALREIPQGRRCAQ